MGASNKINSKISGDHFFGAKIGGNIPTFPSIFLEDGERSGPGVPTIPPSEPQKGTKVWASLQELPRLLASSGGGFGGNLTGNTTPPKMPVLNDGSLCFFPHLFFFWDAKHCFFQKMPRCFCFFLVNLPEILEAKSSRKF